MGFWEAARSDLGHECGQELPWVAGALSGMSAGAGSRWTADERAREGAAGGFSVVDRAGSEDTASFRRRASLSADRGLGGRESGRAKSLKKSTEPRSCCPGGTCCSLIAEASQQKAHFIPQNAPDSVQIKHFEPKFEI